MYTCVGENPVATAEGVISVSVVGDQELRSSSECHYQPDYTTLLSVPCISCCFGVQRPIMYCGVHTQGYHHA